MEKGGGGSGLNFDLPMLNLVLPQFSLRCLVLNLVLSILDLAFPRLLREDANMWDKVRRAVHDAAETEAQRIPAVFNDVLELGKAANMSVVLLQSDRADEALKMLELEFNKHYQDLLSDSQVSDKPGIKTKGYRFDLVFFHPPNKDDINTTLKTVRLKRIKGSGRVSVLRDWLALFLENR